jgi:hypothetical protein
MARVVLLSFSDNDAAEAFVEHTLEAQAAPNGGIPMSISAHVVAHATIEAVVARPTVSCRCRIVGMTQYYREKSQRARAGQGKFVDYGSPEQKEYVSAMGTHVKTERFGWLIHTKCTRPGFYVVQRFIQMMLVGVGCNDLLPEIKEKMKDEVAAHTTETSPMVSELEHLALGPDAGESPRPTG